MANSTVKSQSPSNVEIGVLITSVSKSGNYVVDRDARRNWRMANFAIPDVPRDGMPPIQFGEVLNAYC